MSKKEFWATPDGTVTMNYTDDKGVVDIFVLTQADVIACITAASHADVKHLLADLTAFLFKGRDEVKGLWAKVTGIKGVVEDAAVHALTAIGAKASEKFELWQKHAAESDAAAAKAKADAAIALAALSGPPQPIEVPAPVVPVEPTTPPEGSVVTEPIADPPKE